MMSCPARTISTSPHRSRLLSVCLLGLIGFTSCTTWAQDEAIKSYPNKTIRLVVPYAPGGGTDVLARIAAKELGDALGQPVIVDNRPGAAGIPGTEAVAKAAPDGYTLLMAPSGPLVMNVVLRKSLPYDPIKNFTPVSIVGRLPLLVTVNASLPVNNLKELIDYAKARPTEVTYASSGPLFVLATELFKQNSGTQFLQVPYKSSGESTVALASGQVTMAIADVPPVAGLIKSGKLKAFAYTDVRRSVTFPEVPTVAEAGLPNSEVATLVGVVAPIGTPTPIVQKLQDVLVRMVAKSEIRDRFATIGVEPVGSTSDEFGRAIQQDISRWAAVAKRANIQPE